MIENLLVNLLHYFPFNVTHTTHLRLKAHSLLGYFLPHRELPWLGRVHCPNSISSFCFPAFPDLRFLSVFLSFCLSVFLSFFLSFFLYFSLYFSLPFFLSFFLTFSLKDTGPRTRTRIRARTRTHTLTQSGEKACSSFSTSIPFCSFVLFCSFVPFCSVHLFNVHELQ